MLHAKYECFSHHGLSQEDLKDFFLKFYVKYCASWQSLNMTPEDNFNNFYKGSLDDATYKI